jgi:hypothetical protein
MVPSSELVSVRRLIPVPVKVTVTESPLAEAAWTSSW